jgi:hypothetical protein
MKLFGPRTGEIWRRLSEELGGEYLKSWRGDKVQVSHDDWTITLDTFVLMANNTPVFFTRIRAPFVNPSGFRFSVTRRNVFRDIATWLGAQDVEIGDEAFDRNFIIKSNDVSKVKALLESQLLRDRIEAQSSVSLQVKDDEGWFGTKFPEQTDELYFAVHGVIKDIDRLKALFDLFSETLDELVRVGAAQPGAPGVAL